MRLPSVEERISTQEMKRRHEAIRQATDKQGYDALLVSGQGMFTGRGHLFFSLCQLGERPEKVIEA